MAKRKALRRGNNEGSIHYREKRDLWEAKVTVGRKPDGKLDRRTVYAKTQPEILKKIEVLKQQLSSSTLSNTNQTIEEYLHDWLALKKRTLKPLTYSKKYKWLITKHILPRIGHIKLEKLAPLHVQKMFSQIADSAGPPTANNARRVLFGAMRQAVRLGLIPRNVVEAIAPLPQKQREMKLWSPSEVYFFLDYLRTYRFYALFYLDLSTGLRRGELLALRWEDIQGNIIHVRQSLAFVEKEFVITTPKTKKGMRRIAVSPDVLAVLEEHRQKQEAERKELGALWPENGLIFVSEVGTPYHPDNLTRMRTEVMAEARAAWRKQAEVLQDIATVKALDEGKLLPTIRLHDLRHLHASMAIKSGTDPKVLADRLGHARASFTLDTYTHLFEDQRVTAAVSILDFLPTRQRELT